MAKFNLNMDSQKKFLDKSKKKGGGFAKKMKLEKRINKLMILPGVGESDPVTEVTLYEIWERPGGKPTLKFRVASPMMAKEKDRIIAFGTKLKKKYENSKNKKLKELYRAFRPRTLWLCNAIMMNDEETIKEGPQILAMPKMLYDAVIDEIEEAVENETGVASIFHPDEGRIIKIKHNGLTGLSKQFEAVKFTTETANLISDGHYEEEDLLAKMHDLEKEIPSQDAEEYEKLFKYLKAKAKKIIEEEEGEVADDDDDSDIEDDTPKEESDDADTDDDFDLD